MLKFGMPVDPDATSQRRMRRRRGGCAALVAVLVGLSGMGTVACGRPDTATASSTSTGVSPGDPPHTGAMTVVALPQSTPLRVTIPKIDATSSLVPLGLEADDTIAVPPLSTPLQAGWYSGGPTPGEVGPAVILGQVDGMGSRESSTGCVSRRPGTSS